MRRLRILFVVDHHPPQRVGGYDRWTVSFSRKLASRGHDVTVITRWFSEDVPAEEVIEGIPVKRFRNKHVPGWLWFLGRSIASRGVRPLLRELDGQFDVMMGLPHFIVHAARSAPSIRRIYRAGGTLLGARPHEELIPKTGPRRIRWLSWVAWRQLLHFERAALRLAHRVIANSHILKEQLLYYYGLRDEDVVVISHGVDAERFRPAPRAEDGQFHVVTVGRLNSVKNHALLIEAVARSRNRERMRVRIVGEGALRQRLADHVRRLGLEEIIELSGHSTQVEKDYQWADVFAHPSLYEAFGNAVLEAIACGIPCVALKCRPPEMWVNNDFVQDGVTGLLVPNNDPAMFAEALDRLAEDAELRRRMGRAGRERAVREFTWTIAAEKYEQVFMELVGNSGGR